MVAPYEGDPNAFPSSFSIPDDADPENAASVDVALEALGDRTAYLKRRAGHMQALSFLNEIAPNETLTALRYSPKSWEWLALGSANDYFASTHDVLVWPASTDVPVPQQTGNAIYDFDVDTNGDAVMVDQLIDNMRQRTAAGVWTVNFGEGEATEDPSILYEPISGKWILAFTSGTAQWVRTSTDKFVTWTNRTAPALPIAAKVSLAHDGNGRVVLQGSTGTNAYFSYSDDGGVTWSAPSTHALGFTFSTSGGRTPKPVHTETGWVAIACDTVNRKTRVFSSTNGSTWTIAADLAFVAIYSIAALEGVVLGVGFVPLAGITRGVLVYTSDNGATWRAGEGMYRTGFVPAPPRAVVATRLRFVVLASTRIFPGVAVGDDGEIVT